MSTHPLSRVLTVEPPTSPPDDAPYFDCELCDHETNRLDEQGRCPDCAELFGRTDGYVARLVAELRDDVKFRDAEVRNLRRYIADLQRLVCPDCRGTQTLTDDESSPCPCEGGVR